MTMKNKFKKFGGDFIPDVVEYLKGYIKENDTVTISVGCDSIQRRRKTVYAITVKLYKHDIKNGAHVIFFRENINKVRNHLDRLQKEAEYAMELADLLNEELKPFYNRKDLTDFQRKKYKFHLLKCEGQYTHVPPHVEDNFIKNLTLLPSEKEIEYKLVDIHLDYNPNEGHIDKKGMAKNKSNMSYKTMVPWIRSLGYRVWVKPYAFAASSAADLLLQD